MLSEIRAFLEPWYMKWGVIMLCAAIGIGAYNWICWSGLSASDWGTWIGAIGTVATLIGTIVLASSETRRRWRQEHDAAVIAAAFIVRALIENQCRIKSALVTLRMPVDDNFDNPWHELRGLLAQCVTWSRDELQPLLYVGNNVAAGLAIAQDLTRQAASECEKTSIRKSNGHIDLLELNEKNQQCITLLVAALERIDNAFTVCSNLLQQEKVF